MAQNNILEHLKTLTSGMQIPEDQAIQEWFIQRFMQAHAGTTEEQASDFYFRESVYFKSQLNAAGDKVKTSTVFSLYACFMDVIINGLSFDPDAGLLYIEARGVNVGDQTNKVWQNRAKNKISPYGELALRVKFNQIKYCDDPVVVYECDEWAPGYREDGLRFSKYAAKLPRPAGAKIIGSFMKITRADGSSDFPFFTEENIKEWQAASQKQNSYGNEQGKANALYASNNGQISIGFLKAKTIRHSFKTYPKVKVLGAHTELEEQEIDIPIEKELQQHQQAAIAGGTTTAQPGGTQNNTIQQQAHTPATNGAHQAQPGNVMIDYDETEAPF